MTSKPRDKLMQVDWSGQHAEPGSREWILTQRSLMRACLLDIRNNRHVARLTYADIQKYGGWQYLKDARDRPFETFEQFCESVNGLRLKKEEIEKRLELGEHGGDRRSKARNQVSVAHLKGCGSIERIKARLIRDSRKYPHYADLLQRVESGELSANAAAMEAGFRKKATPLELVLKVLPKLTREERDDVMNKIREMNLFSAEGDNPKSGGRFQGLVQ